MTKEQEKAIETMKHWIDFEKHNRDKINKADDLIKIQETVLNMLKGKDREIEKKDKIIDLMATFIDAQNTRMLEDEYTAIKNIYTIIGLDKDKEEIKQYFEELAERKSEEC